MTTLAAYDAKPSTIHGFANATIDTRSVAPTLRRTCPRAASAALRVRNSPRAAGIYPTLWIRRSASLRRDAAPLACPAREDIPLWLNIREILRNGFRRGSPTTVRFA